MRYEASPDSAYPPSVSVSSDAAGEHLISVITDPDVPCGILSRPGDCLVVKALQRGVLRVEVSSSIPHGSVEATVKIERLKNSEAVTAEAPPPTRVQSVQRQKQRQNLNNAPLDLKGFEVVGHIARLGDVAVGLGEWLAGPSAPSRIEGLSIRWPQKPRDITLNYSVEVGGQEQGTTRSGKDGSFAGTKGRALPLLGLTMALEASDIPQCELNVEGLFLGSALIRQQGQTVHLRGPTGYEPLVGLRIGIQQKTAYEGGQSRDRVLRDTSSEVRVFRGRNHG